MDESTSTKRKRNPGNAGRCTKARSKSRYAKKRKSGKKKAPKQPADLARDTQNDVGNENNNSDQSVPSASKQTASSSKIVISEIPVTPVKSSDTTNIPNAPISGYRLVDMSVLATVFHVVSCPGCGGVNCLKLSDIERQKKGLSKQLQLECSACLYIYTFSTSKRVQFPNEGRGGEKFYDVNARAIYACRQNGNGYEHLKRFCCYMNMPTPMLKNNFQKMSNRLKLSAKHVAEESMSTAAAKSRGDDATADIGVSVDGTWQRKGFTSMNGVITAISVDSGKVLDTAIFSKNCKGCTQMKSVKTSDPQAYEAWHASHKCSLNFKGSSPAMETEGTKHIFKNSVSKHGLCYTSFYGDGDSKAHQAVQDIYGPSKPVEKCTVMLYFLLFVSQ